MFDLGPYSLQWMLNGDYSIVHSMIPSIPSFLQLVCMTVSDVQHLAYLIFAILLPNILNHTFTALYNSVASY